MSDPKVATNLTCSTCGATVLSAHPLSIDQSGIFTYESDDRHVLRFDGGDVTVSKCPKTQEAR